MNVQTSSVTSSDSIIGLTWSPPPVSENLGLTIYSYFVTCWTDSQPDIDKTTDSHSVTFSQLDPFTQYNCCVAANSNNGKGKFACISAVIGRGFTCIIYKLAKH